MQVDWELTGKTALLFHNDDVEESDNLTEWRKDTANKNFSRAGDDRSPAWTWATYLYSDGQSIAYPTYNIMACLRKAAAQVILKGQKTYKEISQSGILMDSEFAEFLSRGKTVPLAPIIKLRENSTDFKAHLAAVSTMGFKLYTKRATVGKAKHVRVRARFDDWKIRGSLLVTAPEINFQVLQQLFDIAGRVGLGDWRPGGRTPGPYGMFTTALTQAKAKKAG